MKYKIRTISIIFAFILILSLVRYSPKPKYQGTALEPLNMGQIQLRK